MLHCAPLTVRVDEAQQQCIPSLLFSSLCIKLGFICTEKLKKSPTQQLRNAAGCRAKQPGWKSSSGPQEDHEKYLSAPAVVTLVRRGGLLKETDEEMKRRQRDGRFLLKGRRRPAACS